jgi:protein-L-isoaspartate O-methyltransferase
MSGDLRQALEESDLFARKSLGQHFLLDLNLTGKITRLAGIQAGETVLEIGPGPGGLTHALLASPAAKVIVVEKDPRFVAHLKSFFADQLDRLVVIEADALAIDEEALLASHGAIVQAVTNTAPGLYVSDATGKLDLRFTEAGALTRYLRMAVGARVTSGSGALVWV